MDIIIPKSRAKACVTKCTVSADFYGAPAPKVAGRGPEERGEGKEGRSRWCRLR